MRHVTLTNYPDAPDIESSTEAYARRFRGRVGQWFLSVQERATEKAIRKQFGDRTGLTIVDVGGGHGQNLRLSTSLGHNLTVVGSTLSGTTQIQDAINSKQIEYVESSLLNLPFPDRSFDVVICYRILSHIHAWEDLCKELMRVSNTLVLVDYPSKRSLNIFSNALYTWKKLIEKDTRRYRLFSDRDLSARFKAENWNRVFVCRQFFLPMALHRLTRSRFFSACLENLSKVLGLTLLFGSPVIAGYICPELIELVLQTETASMHNKDTN